jgi:DNA-binding MarR family transcriptional regulator
VTGPQRLVLRLLGLQPGVSADELAATLHVHPSTLTGILRRLEDQGLLARDPHPADRRRAVWAVFPTWRLRALASVHAVMNEDAARCQSLDEHGEHNHRIRAGEQDLLSGESR